MKVLGRPKEFSSKEEDFQQWSKKTEAFFVGATKEPEMMLEWAAEQTTEITTDSSSIANFLPTVDELWSEEFTKPGVRAAADAYTARTALMCY